MMAAQLAAPVRCVDVACACTLHTDRRLFDFDLIDINGIDYDEPSSGQSRLSSVDARILAVLLESPLVNSPTLFRRVWGLDWPRVGPHERHTVYMGLNRLMRKLGRAWRLTNRPGVGYHLVRADSAAAIRPPVVAAVWSRGLCRLKCKRRNVQVRFAWLDAPIFLYARAHGAPVPSAYACADCLPVEATP